MKNTSGGEKKPKKTKRVSVKKQNDEIDTRFSMSLDDLHLEKYPDIYKLERSEDKALVVLQIFLKECGIGELSVDEIASILKNKLSISVNKGQISMALVRSKTKVDVVRNGKSDRAGRGKLLLSGSINQPKRHPRMPLINYQSI